ncbi:MAG: hypothetical protein NC395_08430 [Prevotella sp.]|nr:hypothetical protein [Prevotella sp.]
MKKIFSVCLMLAMCLTGLTSCGSDNSAELSAELESLRAENEELKQQITETTITTTTEETTTTIEETSEVTTTAKSMTEEEIKSIIGITDAKVTNINSADGVDIAFYWRNNSNKQIKYITFEISVYNAVNDIIYDEISKKSTFRCKLTGPIEPITDKIELAKTTWWDASDLYYYNEYNYRDSVLLDDDLGFCYCGPDIDPNTGVRTRFAIPETDYDTLTIKTEFETLLYNSTARYVEINSIDIDYMDGSNITLNADEVALAYI